MCISCVSHCYSTRSKCSDCIETAHLLNRKTADLALCRWKLAVARGRERNHMELISRLRKMLAEKQGQLEEESKVVEAMVKAKQQDEEARLAERTISCSLKTLVKGRRDTWDTTKLTITNSLVQDACVGTRLGREFSLPGQKTTTISVSRKELAAAEKDGFLLLKAYTTVQDATGAGRMRIDKPSIVLKIVSFSSYVHVEKMGKNTYDLAIDNASGDLDSMLLEKR